MDRSHQPRIGNLERELLAYGVGSSAGAGVGVSPGVGSGGGIRGGSCPYQPKRREDASERPPGFLLVRPIERKFQI